MNNKNLLLEAIDHYEAYTFHERIVLRTLVQIAVDDIAVISILKLSEISKVSRPVVYKALNAFEQDKLIEKIKDIRRGILNSFKLKQSKLEEISKHYETQKIINEDKSLTKILK